MLTIALIDDEKDSLELIKGAFQSVISTTFNEKVDIRPFTNPENFLLTLQEVNYDLICSDIIMTPFDGIELAKRIRAKNKDVALIFISSNETKVFSCFDYNPIGFIRKTNFIQDSKTILKHFLLDIYPNQNKVRNLEVKSHGETVIVDLDKILYLESNHNYQVLYLKDEEEPIEVRMPISYLEKILTPYGFIRVHKGFLVNSKYISKFASFSLFLKNGKEIPISRQTREAIISKYMELSSDTFIV